MEFLNQHLAMILSVALAISEALALIPSFKSSGILDMAIRLLKRLLGKPDKA